MKSGEFIRASTILIKNKIVEALIFMLFLKVALDGIVDKCVFYLKHRKGQHSRDLCEES